MAPPKASTAAAAINRGSRRCQRAGPRRVLAGTAAIAWAFVEAAIVEAAFIEAAIVEAAMAEDSGGEGVSGMVGGEGGGGCMAVNSQGSFVAASMLGRLLGRYGDCVGDPSGLGDRRRAASVGAGLRDTGKTNTKSTGV
jgi:hypothetical protein